MGRLDRIISVLTVDQFDDKLLRQHKMKFPIKNNKESMRIEKLALEKRAVEKTLIEYFQHFKPVNFAGIYNKKQGGFHLIMSNELIMHYNWRGLSGKLPLKDMFLFNTLLYQSWKDQFWTLQHYTKYIILAVLAQYGIRFPITETVEVLRIEQLARNNPAVQTALLQHFSRYQPPEAYSHSKSKKYGLRHILDDKLMSEYNWAGKKKQKPLYKHPLFSRYLYEAWKNEFWTYETYKTYVSASLRAAKNHINQLNYKSRVKEINDEILPE